MKKLFALVVVAIVALTSAIGCGSPSTKAAGGTGTGGGSTAPTGGTGS